MSHLNEICNIHLAYVRFLKRKKKMHRFALIVLSFVNTCIKKKIQTTVLRHVTGAQSLFSL